MESGAMGMLGAAGGLIITLFSLVMLILSVLIPFFVWRIWKWSYTASQELKQLNEKFDRFLALQQTGVSIEPAAEADAAATAFAAATWEAQEEEMPAPPAEAVAPAAEDPLATAFDLDESDSGEADLPASEETAEPAAELEEPFNLTPEPAPETPGEETGFEFSVSPEEAFGSDETTGEEASSDAFDFDASESAAAPADQSDGFAAAPEDQGDDFADAPEDAGLGDDFSSDDSAFEFDAEEDAEAANLDHEFDSVFNSEETTDDSATETDPFADFSADQAAEEEDLTDQAADEVPAEEPEPEPLAEEQPTIIPLESDPQRPTVKLARCGQCDHKLAYKDTLSGKKARCPSCQSAFLLP